jgi:hypothetical protein
MFLDRIYICRLLKGLLELYLRTKKTSIETYLPLRMIGCFLLNLLFLPALAQVSFTTVASSTSIAKGDYLQVEFVVENAKQIDNLQPPAFNGFSIVQGPNQSTGMSVVNGAMSEYKAITFLLQPQHTGKITIPGARATVDGKNMQSNSVVVSVHNGSGSSQPAQPVSPFNPLPDPGWPGDERSVDPQYLLKPGDNVSDIIRKNFFIKVEVSKTDCYVGEPIMATYKLYSRLQSESQVVKQPSLNGFSVFDMTDPGTDQTSVEKINGKPFVVHTIRKVQLVPLVEGPVVLDPVETENTIHFLKREQQPSPDQSSGLRGLIDRLLDRTESGVPFDQQISLQSKPITVTVKPLPGDNKPQDFSGAVGQYSISARVENSTIDTGDASVLVVTVKGSGNLPVVNAPVPQWPAGIETYDVKTKEDIDKLHAPIGGKKTFSYSFIPLQPGQFTVPPVQLTYFDPASNGYKTVQSDPVHFSVAAVSRKKASPFQRSPAEPVTISRGWISGFAAHWEAILSGLLLLAALAYILIQIQLRSVKKQEPPAMVAAAQAPVPAAPPPPDPLGESKKLIASGDYGKFYTSINRSIWKAVAAKLDLPSSELNKSNIATGLKLDGWKEEEIARLKNVLNECEMKLYTPDHNAYDMQRILEEAEEITGRLQES